MKTYAPIAVLLLLAGAVPAAGPPAEKFSEQAEQTANDRREGIVAEIKQLGEHGWAGEYYAGDGLGVNMALAIAPKSGWVFEWRGCMGCYDRNYGAVSLADGRLRLTFTFANTSRGFPGMAPEFIPVRWGSRRYLIPPDDIIGFCNDVNGGDEPRAGLHGSYLLRRGDEQTEVSGFPAVPKEYRPYLLAEPIEAEIIAVGRYTTRPSALDWTLKDTSVTLNAGSTKSLRVGMKLHVIQRADVFESVRISSVEENRSEAIMSQDEKRQGPAVGWRLSTLPSWGAARQVKQTTTRPAE